MGDVTRNIAVQVEKSVGLCVLQRKAVAQSVGARSPSHSIDVCFVFPLIRVAVALNTRKTEH